MHKSPHKQLLAASAITLLILLSPLSGNNKSLALDCLPSQIEVPDKQVQSWLEYLRNPNKPLQSKLNMIQSWSKDLYQRSTLESALRNQIFCILIISFKDGQLDLKTRLKASEALRGIGTGAEDAIPVLEEIFLKDKNPRIRKSAIVAVQGINANSDVKTIIKALQDEDEQVKIAAASALKSIASSISPQDRKEAIKPLTELLQQAQNSEVRQSAADTLGGLTGKDITVIKALNEALKDSSFSVRWRAAQALSNISNQVNKQPEPDFEKTLKDTLPNLDHLLNDDNWTPRSKAAEAISTIGVEDQSIISHLQNILQKDNQPSVRQMAAEALGKIDKFDSSTLQVLTESLKDSDPDVQKAAAEAISKVASQSLTQVEQKNISASEVIASLENAIKTMKSADFKDEEKIINDIQQHLDQIKWTSKWLWVEVGGTNVLLFLTTNKVGNFISLLLIPLLILLVLYPVCLLFLLVKPLWLLEGDRLFKVATIPTPWFNLNASFLVSCKYYSRVLNQWIKQHLTTAQDKFEKKDTVRDRQLYIPSPALLDGHKLDRLTHQDLCCSKFTQPLLIWGEPGSGVTSLACQIARWSMSPSKSKRLCRAHRMIPILIEEDLNLKADKPLLAAIRGKLEDLTNELEPISDELLEQLLKQQCLLVIADRLSEKNKETRELIDPNQPNFPVKALVVTSYQEETLGHVSKTTLKLLSLEGTRVSSFITDYLKEIGKRDQFTDSQLFKTCRELSLMTEQSSMTPHLAKVYTDLMMASPTVQEDARIVAWECVKINYQPTSAKRYDILNALHQKGENADLRLEHLENTLKLIESLPNEEIQWMLAPLAEYLAAWYLLEDVYRDNETKWQNFLKSSSPLSETHRSFFRSLHHCCLTKGQAVKLPSFVTEQLESLQNAVLDTMKEPQKIVHENCSAPPNKATPLVDSPRISSHGGSWHLTTR
jgi:HEAT repeat protein